MKTKIKKDKYLKARGGTYKVYEIFCNNCGTKLFLYQKDGPGILKRLYSDRIEQAKNKTYHQCCGCGRDFGVPYIYEKEKRPAIRLFVGSIRKHYVR